MNVLDKLSAGWSFSATPAPSSDELVEDAVDRLEGKAVTLRPGVEIAAGAVKFVFDDMASAYAAYLAELEDFATSIRRASLCRRGIGDTSPRRARRHPSSYEDAPPF